MKYQLITSNEELNNLCQHLYSSREIAIDTEFTRRKTYYPILGLIQLQIDSEATVLIDPLNINEWQNFRNWLVFPNTSKVFHACSEDFDVIKHYFGVLPKQYIDTQVIASFVGHPRSSGLATLVKHYLNIELDKSECHTDWLKRPLSPTQCQYAASDVIYLKMLIPHLFDDLAKTPWKVAVQEELQNYYEKKIIDTPESLAYLNIKNAWQLSGIALARLQQLAAWRINHAKQQNMALNFVVTEEDLWKVAKYAPRSFSQLSELNIHNNSIRRYGRNLIDCVNAAAELPRSRYPVTIIRPIDLPNYKKNFNYINTIVANIAKQVELPKELLASRKQIDQFLMWQIDKVSQKPDIITGWRGELLETHLVY